MWPSGMKDRNLFVVVGEKRDIVKKKEKSLSKETKVTDTGKSFVSLHRSEEVRKSWGEFDFKA